MGIVAKYKFDGSVYADLIPEFNAEFTNYTVTDNGNIIKNISWLSGYQITIDTGEYYENPNCHSSDFINVYFQGLKCASNQPVDIFWYDENKNYIGGLLWDNNTLGNDPSILMDCPENARYVKLSQYANRSGLIVTAGEITRTIESNSLPTLMRFGIEGDNHADNSRQDSLLEILEMDTSALTTCKRMFGYCKNLTNIECVWDTSNVDNMLDMFAHCQSLTKLDLSSFDTSDVVNMQGVFYNCQSLTKLDLSSFDTSNVVTMYAMFYNCKSLTKLDLSSFDTNDVVNMYSMISECYNLTSLDISNFNTSNVTDMAYMLKNAFLLTDVGMVYCDQSTINKVASLLPTDHNITIWVESDDILQYDQYDHITYKTQKVQDTVHLNSPLLMGDTIEVVDGKTYHVHRWEKIVLDDTWEWKTNQYCHNTAKTTTLCTGYNNKTYWIPNLKGVSIDGKANILCDKVNTSYFDTEIENIHNDKWGLLYLTLSNDKLITPDNLGFLNWLKDNPITAIVPLATPYYELISEEPLELTLLDTTDNTINNNSILPSNMTIANKELSTIAIKPSTTYTLSFDKSNVDSEVTIDICGGEQITTVLNRVELTTPSELGSGIRFISSDGCIISNVRLLEGSLVEKAIPKETFEGLKSSFEDGYIIGENLVIDGEVAKSPSSIVGETRIVVSYNMNKVATKNKIYTLICNISDLKGDYKELHGSLNGGLVRAGKSKVKNGINMLRLIHDDTIYEPSNVLALYFMPGTNDFANVNNIILLEGDHTHLSEAELMRYIEKDTSHYEEEDYNHIGKYKVQYKVTGKNKFDKDRFVEFNKDLGWQCDIVTYNNKECVSIRQQNYQKVDILNSLNLNKKKTYSISFKYFFEKSDEKAVVALKIKYTDGTVSYDSITVAEGSRIITTEEGLEIEEMYIGEWGHSGVVYLYDFQIEEGTVATEYELYKEDIKTYYLSSPLLEGDTIEDVNGVATHVKRYGKVVLDGSEQWEMFADIGKFYSRCIDNYAKDTSISISDKFADRLSIGDTIKIGGGLAKLGIHKLDKTTVSDFKQWLSQNPTTVVYQLASPIYETISTESILCDSYVNGHLDFDSAVPVEKVVFKLTPDILNNYLLPSTLYTLKFDSDNSGVIDVLYLGGRTVQNNILVKKGVNTISFTLPNTLYNNKLHFEGIGFNISNIQVVATDRDVEFDYFKGLKSSFEDGLVIDENDENYGKYKVECKIVGKNKWHLGDLYFDTKTIRSDGVTPLFKKGVYTLSCDVSIEGASIRFMDNSDKEISWKLFTNETITLEFKEDIYTIHLYSTSWSSILSKDKFVTINNIQLEEGTQATSYEPYKESIHTLYLNSPLLKGDKLVVHDGKLCHYHKMGMVVLDGSEEEGWWRHADSTDELSRFLCMRSVFPGENKNNDGTYASLCDTLSKLNTSNKYYALSSSAGMYILCRDIHSLDGFKQWLQQNPTTVVYELETPYYEPIEPQLSQYSFSTVKDGDMEIITVLPIEKINLTYRTDINGVSSIEEQIASIQEGTDISSIIDEEVDE